MDSCAIQQYVTTMKKAFFLGCLLLLFTSCSDYEVRRQLVLADSLCETDPDSSLSVIRVLRDSVGEWYESDRIYSDFIHNQARIKKYCEKNIEKDELEELFQEQASVLNESHQRTDRLLVTIITILFVLLILIGLVLLYYILQHKAELRHLRYLQFMNDRKSDQIKRMEEETNGRMSENDECLQKLVASPEMAAMRKRCVNGELPTAEEWEQFQGMMDALYGFFVQQLVSVFHLSTQEIHVCLLVKAQFKPSEIAVLTARSKEAISSTRRRLYKKITGKGGTPEQLDKLIMKW